MKTAFSIAGFDPSGGAGALADIKVFEAYSIHGFSALTALTIQNDKDFYSTNWLDLDYITSQIDVVLGRFKVKHFKIGIIENLDILNSLVDHIHSKVKEPFILWDPILSSTSGFDFHKEVSKEKIIKIAKKLSLVTPNFHEARVLMNMENQDDAAKELSKYCPVFLTAGETKLDFLTDILFIDEKSIPFKHRRIEKGEKHGSGCVLSSSIIAEMVQDLDLINACEGAKYFTYNYLESTDYLLGIHEKKYF